MFIHKCFCLFCRWISFVFSFIHRFRHLSFCQRIAKWIYLPACRALMLISFFFSVTCDACIILHTIGGLTSVAVLFDWNVFFSLWFFALNVSGICGCQLSSLLPIANAIRAHGTENQMNWFAFISISFRRHYYTYNESISKNIVATHLLDNLSHFTRNESHKFHRFRFVSFLSLPSPYHIR